MRIAFPTDEHVPYQDDKARQVALKIVQDFKPDLLVVGSDGLDFYGVSSFDKNPDRESGMQAEIDKWKVVQREWRSAVPEASRRFIPGNHEDRLRRYMWRHPELSDLEVLHIDQILGFVSLGIEWDMKEYVNAEINIFGKLVIKHGRFIRKFASYTAKAELDAEMHSISVITGHTHRGGSHYVRTRTGVVQAHEAFCLCKLDPEYVSRPDWQQGIVLAEVTKDYVSVEPIPFFTSKNKRAAVWRGNVYQS